MVCISLEPFLDDFYLKSRKAYSKTFKICDSEVPQVFRKVEESLKKGQSKIKTHDEFAVKSREIFDSICKHISPDKQFEFSQELDKILIQLNQDIKERETLHLASKLQKKIGHRLQKFRSVCGYGLSGVFMKFEIKMLKESNEQDEIVAFVEKVMNQCETEIKEKKVYDLVVFVVIGKLPVLNQDQHLKLEVRNHTGEDGPENDVPSFQTVGALFRIEGEDGWYFSTCTHGKDFTKYKFKIHLEGMAPLDAQFMYVLYTKPNEQPHCEFYFNEEKDVHNTDRGHQASGCAYAMDTDEIDRLVATTDRGHQAYGGAYAMDPDEIDKLVANTDRGHQAYGGAYAMDTDEIDRLVANTDRGHQAYGGAYAMDTDEIDRLVANTEVSSRFTNDSPTTAAEVVDTSSDLGILESRPGDATAAYFDADTQELSDIEMDPVVAPSARGEKRGCELQTGQQCGKLLRREMKSELYHEQASLSNSTNAKTTAVKSYQSTGSATDSGYGSSLTSNSSRTSMFSQSSISSESSASLSQRVSRDGDVFEDFGSEPKDRRSSLLRKKASCRKSSDGTAVSRAISGISLSDSANSHQLDPTVVAEALIQINDMDKASKQANVSAGDSSQNPGPSSRGDTNIDAHIDLCLLKVHVKSDEEGISLSKLNGPNDPRFTSMDTIVQENAAVGIEAVKKYGITTGVTKGRVVSWNDTLQGILNREIVWMNNMIVTEQLHSYPQVCFAQSSPEPLVLIPDVRTASTSQDVNPSTSSGLADSGDTDRLPPFAKRGDSGAIITTTDTQAIANHLYHYNWDANVYKKKLNYSVSLPLGVSIRELELKIGKKIQMIPIFIPMEVEIAQ